MALDLSKLNFFKRLDARGRIIVLVSSVIAIIFLVYLGTRLLFGGGPTTGTSRVANAPQGLQSVPGGQLSPEYARALREANVQAAKQAQMSGTSAVPTLMNIGGGQPTTPQAGCIICTEQTPNVKNLLDQWVREGKISPDVATMLQQLADKNVPVDEYAAALDKLVKEGKLTPEQARELLEQYKKQHANAVQQESAKAMDAMIKSGELPLDAANELLDAQKREVSPAEYAQILQRLVREGKISPETAQRLLAQYTQQRAKEIVMRSIAALHRMAARGEITPDVEKNLVDLENKMVPIDAYAATLQQYVSSGKLTPAVAAKILDEFKSQKAEIGPTQSINQMLQQAEAAAYNEISDLLKAGKITPEVAQELAGMIQKDVPFDAFRTAVNHLVDQKKLTPEIAKLKVGDYKVVKGLREEAKRLAALQGNNASPADYAEELRRAVAEGVLTPEQAAQLMQEYQAMTARGVTPPPAVGPGNEAFAQLQQRVAQGATTAQPIPTPAEFATAQAQAQVETAQERASRIDALVNSMNTQAQQLVAAWQPPTMVHREGSRPAEPKVLGGKASGTGGATGAGAAGKEGTSGEGQYEGAPLIKAGSILFATLDTAINSDYPDSPVMATIVEGKFKGAKLLGKLTTVKGVSGQMDRVMLNFTMMNSDTWPRTKSVTAYAIDPDTARTVLATSVNYHYLQRFGAMMATSLMQGYSSAITNAGTSTTGIFGTSTTHPALSSGQKIFVALGQMGQTVGAATQNYINIPPTVRVDSGVGLGILFMSDVAH